MATGAQSRRLFPEPHAGLGSPAYEGDRLPFPLPEIARPLRTRLGREIGHPIWRGVSAVPNRVRTVAAR